MATIDINKINEQIGDLQAMIDDPSCDEAQLEELNETLTLLKGLQKEMAAEAEATATETVTVDTSRSGEVTTGDEGRVRVQAEAYPVLADAADITAGMVTAETTADAALASTPTAIEITDSMRPLSRAEWRQIQEALKACGKYEGAIDGLAFMRDKSKASNTERALFELAEEAGVPPEDLDKLLDTSHRGSMRANADLVELVNEMTERCQQAKAAVAPDQAVDTVEETEAIAAPVPRPKPVTETVTTEPVEAAEAATPAPPAAADATVPVPAPNPLAVAHGIDCEGVRNLGFMKRGSRGDKVEALQNIMVEAGLMTQAEMNTGPGIFGEKTERAVRHMQDALGIKVDGEVGDQTLGALCEALQEHETIQALREQMGTGEAPTPAPSRGATELATTATTPGGATNRQEETVSTGTLETGGACQVQPNYAGAEQGEYYFTSVNGTPTIQRRLANGGGTPVAPATVQELADSCDITLPASVTGGTTVTDDIDYLHCGTNERVGYRHGRGAICVPEGGDATDRGSPSSPSGDAPDAADPKGGGPDAGGVGCGSCGSDGPDGGGAKASLDVLAPTVPGIPRSRVVTV